MGILQVEQISKTFGEKKLFENISFGIEKGEKVALIAKNGKGKSTILNIISNLEQPEEGKVIFQKDTTLAYLAQEPNVHEYNTVLDYVYGESGIAGKYFLEYKKAVQQENEELIAEYSAKIDQHHLWDYENTVGEVLGKFQLKGNMLVSSLSGGQKKRAALAATLVSNPDILLLDEPTNHLDVDMIEWMEEFLSRSTLTIFMVTHDRYFLDNVCNVILELDQGQIWRYQGNYSYYLEKRAERIEAESKSIEKAKNLWKTELEWIRRQPKARGTKSRARIDAFHELDKKAHSGVQENDIKLDVKMTRLGNKILEFKDVCFKWDNYPVLDKFSYIFKKGERVGVIGNNGVGKSTFLNILAGGIAPLSGFIDTGETIRFGYYKQQPFVADENERVIDIVKRYSENVTLSSGVQLGASQMLTRFLFTNEEQYTPFGKLSGGEKRRLYLLTILIQNPNFLILDEPTNDLDIQTLSVLEEFLSQFQGCLIIVSHDRFFMDRIVEHLFVFEGNAKISDFPGNYTQFRIKELEKQQENYSAENKNTNPAPKKEIAKENNTKRKLSWKEQKEFEGLESEIAILEKERNLLTDKLQSIGDNYSEIQAISQKLEETNNLLEEKEMRWLELSEFAN